MKTDINKEISTIGLGITLVLGITIGAEAAVIPAYTVSNITSNPITTNRSTAVRFQVTTDLTVRGIGVYVRGVDNGGSLSLPGGSVINGISRQVALWSDLGGAPILQRFIGNSDGLLDTEGNFRYVDVTPFTLPAGIYRLGSLTNSGVNGDNATFSEANVLFANELTVTPTIIPQNTINLPPNDRVNSYTISGGSLTFPTTETTSSYLISANLLFDDPLDAGGGNPDTPEPNLIGGLLLLGCLGGLRKRKED